jgi:diadenosine tetraphosphate (Ap4A) HIT family hydrolase
MPTLIHRRVELCRSGRHPSVVCRVASGWVVLGDMQVTRGYSLLLPDPVVGDLNAMDVARRRVFLEDMTRLGDALLALTGAVRINYEILGNLEPALHAHAIPRYADEPEELRQKPIWFYDWKAAPPFDPRRDAALMRELAKRLQLAAAGV